MIEKPICKGTDISTSMGHPILDPTWQGDLPDCPKCKYGTPRQISRDPNRWRCIDCGYEFIKLLADSQPHES
jgi:hypothetical protein